MNYRVVVDSTFYLSEKEIKETPTRCCCKEAEEAKRGAFGMLAFEEAAKSLVGKKRYRAPSEASLHASVNAAEKVGKVGKKRKKGRARQSRQ